MDKIAKIYKGIISLNGGEYEIPCYVIDDGEKVERVLSQREVVRLISGGRDSGNLNAYLSAKNIQAILPEKFQQNRNQLKIKAGRQSGKKDAEIVSNKANVLIFRVGSTIINGIRSSDVIDICNTYLKARQLGILAPNQSKLAEQSEIFISASAKSGIDAVIDEVTGYQYFRKAEDSINAAKKEAAKIDSILEARKKPLEISVSQLIAAYDANEIAADMHLKGRIISVAGVITDFGTEILGRKYVIIEDPNIPFYYVQCVFKREYSDRLARYSKGDVISVTGECRGKGVLSDYNILMDECK